MHIVNKPGARYTVDIVLTEQMSPDAARRERIEGLRLALEINAIRTSVWNLYPNQGGLRAWKNWGIPA